LFDVVFVVVASVVLFLFCGA